MRMSVSISEVHLVSHINRQLFLWRCFTYYQCLDLKVEESRVIRYLKSWCCESIKYLILVFINSASINELIRIASLTSFIRNATSCNLKVHAGSATSVNLICDLPSYLLPLKDELCDEGKLLFLTSSFAI